MTVEIPVRHIEPTPLALVVLMMAVVAAALAVRLWRQGFVLHAAFAMIVPPEYAEAAFVEMVVTGLVQLICLTGWFVHARMLADLTPARIRIRARALPRREPGYSAASV